MLNLSERKIFKIEMGRLYNFYSMTISIKHNYELKQKTKAGLEIGS